MPSETAVRPKDSLNTGWRYSPDRQTVPVGRNAFFRQPVAAAAVFVPQEPAVLVLPHARFGHCGFSETHGAGSGFAETHRTRLQDAYAV
ncbi:hypothetical protein [Neisseria leonii]|uniref:hypothetical protein n=1 Tax=Neisseria leonii TaxID=2995413 RepID=UPI00237BC21C|nr:hypothetical protein [Neisseria sp. 3986]MDD9326684.1 hypothetical protein [Neisseria sp. 3986]